MIDDRYFDETDAEREMSRPMKGTRHMSDFTPCEAFASAARYVQREWGDTGYGIRPVGRYGNVWVFEATCYGDGSYFNVFADRWGNCDQVRDDETVETAYVRATSEREARMAELGR